MLELRNISYRVPADSGEKEIIRDVSLTLEDRNLLVITGPNGSGKSTLAKLIVGIEKPSSGTIYYDGEDITDLNTTERARRGIGFAFQNPVRFKGLEVRDLLNLAAGRSMSTEAACRYLSEVGLCAVDYIDRELNNSLSGGELKRIEIAMVLARGSKLAVFDEPEAGIDLWSFHNLIRAFEKMRGTGDGSIVIISHQERILSIADKIVVLANGTIAAEGIKEDILPELLKDSEACAFFREEVTAL